MQTLYTVLADIILVSHILVVIFVVFGLVLILLGGLIQRKSPKHAHRWNWVRNPWFRIAHVCTIIVVALQAWAGVVCPLTIWEMALREKAGLATYEGSFITYWLNQLLYYEAPAWVFTAAYTGFASLVIISWFWVKPRSLRS